MICACTKIDTSHPDGHAAKGIEATFVHSEFLENESLSSDEAALVAEISARTFMPSTKSRDRTPDNTFPLLTKDGKIWAYAVNYKKGGYSIISATQKYTPVIAFSEEGIIEESTLTSDNPFAFYMNIMANDVQQRLESWQPQDSLSERTSAMWQKYKSEVAELNSATTSGYAQSHVYWYGEERSKAMSSRFTDTANLMSSDLNRYNDIVTQSYSVGHQLSSGTIANYKMENAELKRNYSRAGLSSSHVESYFWNEFYRETVSYDSGELITTRWHQLAPYNKYNPDRTDGVPGQQPAGCVTIAVSQILNYHKFPDELKRIAALHTVTMNVDWKLTDRVSLDETDSNEAIPRLIRFVNQGVHTTNGNEGSSSNIEKAKSFLEGNGYLVEHCNGINAGEWESLIRNKYPIYVRGKEEGKDSGHAFICMGYKETALNVYLELKSTRTLTVNNFNYSPYSTVSSLKGKKVYPSTVYFCFNWGWGTGYPNTWILKPIGNINGYADVEYLIVMP